MSIDKSLKRKVGGSRNRCVLTRVERIAKMLEQGRFKDGQSPFGLPKTRVQKIALKKKVKKEAEGDAAPAADAKKK
jgi:small basic protein (TIGR04137 family)